MALGGDTTLTPSSRPPARTMLNNQPISYTLSRSLIRKVRTQSQSQSPAEMIISNGFLFTTTTAATDRVSKPIKNATTLRASEHHGGR